ncbi:50S ribosomal protein L19e [Candidatus Woesearchaeota archaeon CG10_big_fil_rev_8_21_14_0_10_45_5]|nr:MAG: 50S ribosomal protein L19e [Candidatus Woesearchaeota archaeon CG10_big_fil_rev_8_21_14_0_10_45_5]PIU29699.1 MAG: 50S ribosomal protein L19e [Candidatus Woesearchaeota archaeon CG07_land_8_20_14_0_80_44_23]
MNLKVQKRIAANILKCSPKRVHFDTERLDEIKEAITKQDLRALISSGAIVKKSKSGVSRGRARKILIQKRKGRQRNAGSIKGKIGARLPQKKSWMNKVRLQRKFLKELKEKGIIDKKAFRTLYLKSKGGMFRSKRHLKLYIDEQGLALKENNAQ